MSASWQCFCLPFGIAPFGGAYGVLASEDCGSLLKHFNLMAELWPFFSKLKEEALSIF